MARAPGEHWQLVPVQAESDTGETSREHGGEPPREVAHTNGLAQALAFSLSFLALLSLHACLALANYLSGCYFHLTSFVFLFLLSSCLRSISSFLLSGFYFRIRID